MSRVLLIAAVLSLGGCYDPTIEDGTLQCAIGNVCPQGYVCSENLCYHPGHQPDGGITDASASPPVQLRAGSRLASVAADESYLAYYDNVTVMSSTPIGDMTIARMGSPGTAVATQSGAFNAGFSSTGVVALYYSIGATPSVDTGSTALYGQLGVWTPSLTKTVTVSTTLATLQTTSAGNKFTIFLDTPTASTGSVGNVVLVRSADCGGTSCNPIVLQSGVTMSPNGFVTSNDEKYAAYATKASTTSYQLFLVDIANGTNSSLGPTTAEPSIAFSPDGGLLAVGATTLQMFSPATALPVTWSPLLVGTTRVHQLAFSDPATLILRGLQTSTGENIFSLTATATTQISTTAAQAFELPRPNLVTTATSRYLFANTMVNDSIGDLQLYDLQATPPVAIQVATAASTASVGVTGDESVGRFLENYDATKLTGTLTTIALPPSGNMVAEMVISADVPLSSLGTARASELTYIDNARAGLLSVIANGLVVPIADNVQVFRTRATPSSLLYFSNTLPDTRFGLAPGIYVTPLP